MSRCFFCGNEHEPAAGKSGSTPGQPGPAPGPASNAAPENSACAYGRWMKTLKSPTVAAGALITVLLLTSTVAVSNWYRQEDSRVERVLAALADMPENAIGDAAPPAHTPPPARSRPAVEPSPPAQPPTSGKTAAGVQVQAPPPQKQAAEKPESRLMTEKTARPPTPRRAPAPAVSPKPPADASTAQPRPPSSAPARKPAPARQWAKQTLDQKFQARAARCGEGILGLFCREKIRFSLCSQRWSESPPAGEKV